MEILDFVLAKLRRRYDDLSAETVTANQTRESEEARVVQVDLPKSPRNPEGRAHPSQAGSAGDRTAAVIDTLVTSEAHEIAAWRDLAAAASGHGLAADERGRAFLMAAPGCPIAPFNRVLGIGRHGPATIDEISEAAAWFADRGVDRYWLQFGTVPVPSRVERWLAAHHFVLEYRSVLLARNLRAPLAGPASDLDVRRVGADAARGVGRVAAESFGWPPAAQDLSACVVGRPGWRHYLVYEGPVPVGAGAAYEAGGTVWLGFGGVLATHRRRGGQAALLARRIEDAARDCHTAIVDAEEGSSSHRNCLRAGFVEVGVRPIYEAAPRRGVVNRLLGLWRARPRRTRRAE